METSIKDWFAQLGSKTPAPGGGAVPGLNAALAAATLKMVCEFSTGPRFAEIEDKMKESASKLEELVREGLDQAKNDEAAYGKLREAFAVPKDSPARPAALEVALKAAVGPAQNIIGTAGSIVDMAEEIFDKSNKNLVSDIAVAAANARAALESAIVNIQINATLIKDENLRNELAAKVTEAEALINRAAKIYDSARNGI